jgi:hypothetical protein
MQRSEGTVESTGRECSKERERVEGCEGKANPSPAPAAAAFFPPHRSSQPPFMRSLFLSPRFLPPIDPPSSRHSPDPFGRLVEHRLLYEFRIMVQIDLALIQLVEPLLHGRKGLRDTAVVRQGQQRERLPRGRHGAQTDLEPVRVPRDHPQVGLDAGQVPAG